MASVFQRVFSSPGGADSVEEEYDTADEGLSEGGKSLTEQPGGGDTPTKTGPVTKPGSDGGNGGGSDGDNPTPDTKPGTTYVQASLCVGSGITIPTHQWNFEGSRPIVGCLPQQRYVADKANQSTLQKILYEIGGSTEESPTHELTSGNVPVIMVWRRPSNEGNLGTFLSAMLFKPAEDGAARLLIRKNLAGSGPTGAYIGLPSFLPSGKTILKTTLVYGLYTVLSTYALALAAVAGVASYIAPSMLPAAAAGAAAAVPKASAAVDGAVEEYGKFVARNALVLPTFMVPGEVINAAAVKHLNARNINPTATVVGASGFSSDARDVDDEMGRIEHPNNTRMKFYMEVVMCAALKEYIQRQSAMYPPFNCLETDVLQKETLQELLRHYDTNDDKYNTQWSEAVVGCVNKMDDNQIKLTCLFMLMTGGALEANYKDAAQLTMAWSSELPHPRPIKRSSRPNFLKLMDMTYTPAAETRSDGAAIGSVDTEFIIAYHFPFVGAARYITLKDDSQTDEGEIVTKANLLEKLCGDATQIQMGGSGNGADLKTANSVMANKGYASHADVTVPSSLRRRLLSILALFESVPSESFAPGRVNVHRDDVVPAHASYTVAPGSDRRAFYDTFHTVATFEQTRPTNVMESQALYFKFRIDVPGVPTSEIYRFLNAVQCMSKCNTIYYSFSGIRVAS